MKKILLLLAVMSFAGVVAHAETIYLKDGRVVEGKIMRKGTDAVVIEVNGIPRRFFNQEIDRIDDGASEMDAPEMDHSLKNLRSLSEIPEEKVKTILRFLEVDGTKKRMQENLKAAINNAPPEKQQQLKSVIDVNEILNELVPMYDKVFKKHELDEIILFYESFAGKKLIDVTPIILNETVKITYTYVYNKIKTVK